MLSPAAKMITLAWVGALLSAACAHQVPTGDTRPGRTQNEKLLNEIWTVTKTHELFAGLPIRAPIQEMIRERFRHAGPVYQAKVLTLLDEATQSDKLQAMLKSRMLRRFDTAKAESILTFFATPLGKAYAQIGDHFDPQSPAFKAFLENPPPSPKRLAALGQLLLNSGSKQLAALTLVTPIETIFMELAHQKRLARTPSKPAGQRALRESMASVVTAMHKAMLVGASFSHRDLSDKQLGILLQFEKTKAAKWYTKTFLRAYEQTLQVSSRRFTRAMLIMLEEEPPVALIKPDGI